MIADEIAQQMRDAATKVTLLGASWSAECNRSERLEARVAELEAAIDKAIKHADGNGMKDWPAFRTLRKVMKSR